MGLHILMVEGQKTQATYKGAIGMEQTGQQTYRVNVQNMGWLEDKLGKLQRKAVKLGLEPLKLVKIGEEIVHETRKEGNAFIGFTEIPTGRVDVYNILKIDGASPVIRGWRLVAILEATQGDNIVRSIGKVIVPEQYRHTGTTCEHCGANRRRNDTFLLVHENGEYIQVGRNCLKDFLGHDPSAFLSFASEIDNIFEYFAELEKPEYYPPRDHAFIDVKRYLSFVVKCIREDGWVSRQQAKEFSTADRAMNDMFPHPKYTPTEPTEEDDKLANDAYEWTKTQESVPNMSDYMHNIVTIAKNGYMQYRDAGFCASIIVTYQKHLEREIKRKAHINTGNSKHVGVIGARGTWKVTFQRRFTIDTMYGTMKIYHFVDDQGNVMIWKTSTWMDLTEGNVYSLTGTVKTHGEYKGTKQTEVNRCKVQELQKQGA